MRMSGQSEAGRRYSTVEILERLVAFDTTSDRPNLDLIGFVRDYLDTHGVPYRISTDETGQKADIHAIVGPQSSGGIALSGHVDTVPVEGQAWTSNPRTLQHRDGKWYARGAADMKGFVASALAAVPEMQARGLVRPMHLFISYDEETTCDGARRLIEDLRESGLRPEFCIVGEPSGMRPVVAHKGRMAVRVLVHGLPGHSSEPARGVNAVHAAAEAIAWVSAEARRFASEGPFEEGFDPPHTTIHVGTVRGGTSLNIIPERAEFVMEWRTVPADDFFREIERMREFVGRTIEPAMRQVGSGTGFAFEVVSWIPGLSLAPDHQLTGIVKQLTGSNSIGKVSYGTEGGLYQEAGIPTIICGPGHIAQAHQPDEWIAQSQLDECDAFVRRLTDRLLV
jgi:acetylornithine deacetylase